MPTFIDNKQSDSLNCEVLLVLTMECKGLFTILLLADIVWHLGEACTPAELATDKEVYQRNERLISTCKGCTPIVLRLKVTDEEVTVIEERYYLGMVKLEKAHRAVEGLQILCYSDRTGNYEEINLKQCQSNEQLLCAE